MHDHSNLPEIFWYLWGKGMVERGSFADLTFRLVFFHISRTRQAHRPAKYCLSPTDLYTYTDPQFLKLLQVLMLADTLSYTIVLFGDREVKEN